MKYPQIIAFLTVAAFMISCGDDVPKEETPETIVLSSSPQRIGDATRGYNYLVSGDYVDSGVPLELYLATRTGDDQIYLNRTGDNARVEHQYSAVIAPNGAKVLVTNCLVCHAGNVNGEFVMGLGNSLADFTKDRTNDATIVDITIKSRFGEKSKEWDAYQAYRRALFALAPVTVTKSVGANPADKYAWMLGAYRNPKDLTWLSKPQFPVTDEVVHTDVPPLWNLKKRNTMFYTGAGTGDFARLMMASSLLTLNGTDKAKEVDGKFPDVLAYINTLQPPKYKGTINTALVTTGKRLFEENCSRCHGTYGVGGQYPNVLVAADKVGTDNALITANYAFPQFVDWYNTSWFAEGSNAAKLVPQKGYIAPPLDGVWATAPYLHNGSVPTLDDLLNSSQRPKMWRRSLDSKDFDNVKIGWKYTIETTQKDAQTFNTALKGYGNQGHIYADKFSADERKAVIEYLKTL
jgi:mono/diheme cytochrome c family protein